MKMTFKEYEDKIKKYESYSEPILSSEYGITLDDIETMRKGKDKYVEFLLFLQSRTYYRLENIEPKEFVNDDALECHEASRMIDDLVNELVDLED